MNSKRQTIWLVSMLSLMVVLSAYYLFTDDADKLNKTAEQAQTEQIKIDTQAAAGQGSEQGEQALDKDKTALEADKLEADQTKDTNLADAGVDAAAADAAKGAVKDSEAVGAEQPVAKGDKTAAPETDAAANAASGQIASGNEQAAAGLTDAKILQKVESQGQEAGDYFTFQQMTKNDELSKKMDDLQTVMANTKESVEVQSKAYEDYSKLEDQQARQTRIEEQLLKDGYGNVVLLQESGKWKVVVAADKLEKTQAVSILDLVTEQLNVAPDKVSVQYRNN